MSQFFWETTHTARIEHFCDHCCTWIQPGERYLRRVQTFKDRLCVWKEHDASCELEEPDWVREEQEAEAAVSLAIALEVRTVAVEKVQRHGVPITEYELQAVPVTVIAEPSYGPEDDTRIPF